MTLHLDPPLRVGRHVVVAACEVKTSASRRCGVILGHGRKSPRILLIRTEGQLSAIDLHGPGPVDEIDPDLSEVVTRHIAAWEGNT